MVARRLPSLVAALLLGACAAAEPAVRVDADPTADLSAWRTFTWAGPASAEGTDPDLDAEARAAVAEALQARGYAEGEPAQFAVAVYFGAPSDPQLYTEGPRYGVAPDPRAGERGWGGLLDWPLMREPGPGNLTVDMVDVARRQPVWRGTSRAHLGRDADAADVEAVVAAVLAEFPAAPG